MPCITNINTNVILCLTGIKFNLIFIILLPAFAEFPAFHIGLRAMQLLVSASAYDRLLRYPSHVIS